MIHQYAHSFDYIMHGYMLRTWNITMSSTRRVLELGCYHGEFTKRLMGLHGDVTAIEGDPKNYAHTVLAVPQSKVIWSTFEDYQPTHAFDAIFLMHTLEHVADPGLLLQRIRTWLAPRGLLYVAVPNAFAGSRQIAVEMGVLPQPWSITPHEASMGHLRTYDLTYLRRTVTDAGLRIVDSGGIFFKALANFQIDKALEDGIIDRDYLEGCFQLGKRFPDFCSSIYTVCEA